MPIRAQSHRLATKNAHTPRRERGRRLLCHAGRRRGVPGGNGGRHGGLVGRTAGAGVGLRLHSRRPRPRAACGRGRLAALPRRRGLERLGGPCRRRGLAARGAPGARCERSAVRQAELLCAVRQRGLGVWREQLWGAGPGQLHAAGARACRLLAAALARVPRGRALQHQRANCVHIVACCQLQLHLHACLAVAP